MRIATLIGKSLSGDLIGLGIAEGAKLDELVGRYNAIVASKGRVPATDKRAKDLLLSELHLLANATSGGELKARRRFNHPVVA